MIKVLLTGFGPFPGVQENPSEKLVRELSCDFSSLKLYKEILPTEWERGLEVFRKQIENINPDLCIHLGVHSSATKLTLEQMAVNRTDDREDACGNCFFEPRIDATTGPHLNTDLPIKDIAESLGRAGYPADISTDAGEYICNFIYFHSLKAFADRSSARHALFVHIPGETNSPPTAKFAVSTAIEVIINASAAHLSKSLTSSN